jgi:hypothetical protein
MEHGHCKYYIAAKLHERETSKGIDESTRMLTNAWIFSSAQYPASSRKSKYCYPAQIKRFLRVCPRYSDAVALANAIIHASHRPHQPSDDELFILTGLKRYNSR